MEKKKFFTLGDVDAGIGVFFDSFIKISIALSFLTSTLSLSTEFILSNVLSGLGLSVFIFCLFTTFSANHLNKKCAKNSATAIPGGISSSVFFVWLSSILLPTYIIYADGMFAIGVTLSATVIFSLLQICFSFFAEKVFNIIPRPVLLTILIGGTMTWLLLSPLGDSFANPFVIIPTLFCYLSLFFSKTNLKFGSPILLSISIGTIIAWIIGSMQLEALKEAFSDVAFYHPRFSFSFYTVDTFKVAFDYFPLIISFVINDLITSIQGIGQAKIEGDAYSIKASILGLGLSNLVGAIFGNPFPMNYYFGHTSWKKVGAKENYPIIVGSLHLLFCITGISSIVTSIFPINATLIILIFIGLTSIKSSILEIPSKYYGPMIIGMVIPIFDLINRKISSIVNLFQDKLSNENIFLTKNILNDMLDSAGYGFGYSFLANGSLTLSLLYTAIFVYLVDRKWKNIGLTFLLISCFTYIGLIHSNEIGIYQNPGISLIYLILSISFFIIYYFNQLKIRKGNK